MNVYVFKTSVTPKDLKQVQPLLEGLVPQGYWNFDLEDCDRILRVESPENISKFICQRLQKVDFFCEELE